MVGYGGSVGGGIWWREIVEGNGGGVGHQDWREMVGALVEGFGEGIWWK
jgi:hypothetical protein